MSNYIKIKLGELQTFLFHDPDFLHSKLKVVHDFSFLSSYIL